MLVPFGGLGVRYQRVRAQVVRGREGEASPCFSSSRESGLRAPRSRSLGLGDRIHTTKPMGGGKRTRNTAPRRRGRGAQTKLGDLEEKEEKEELSL